jgi:ABC-2 type transport system ATP-binding protein
MTPAISLTDLTKVYGTTRALDGVTIDFAAGQIHGLFGNNGAGKTTLMTIATAQNFATSGTVRVLGHDPYEHARTLSRVCFIRESQRYPEDARAWHVFRMARLFYDGWDQAFADRLVKDFQIDPKQKVKKMSTGQKSAVGAVISLASRAEITLMDEPYSGLDAGARQTLYDRLLEDYADHPRTFILSSHLIDEISNLIENVVVLDRGRVLIDRPHDELTGEAYRVVGAAGAAEAYAAGREVLHREALGPIAALTIRGHLTSQDRGALTQAGLAIEPISLQQLVVALTRHASAGAPQPTAEPPAPGSDPLQEVAR